LRRPHRPKLSRRETRQKKSSPSKQADDLRPEYRRSDFGPMVRGKYYRQAVTALNLILIEPELVRAFPNSESVNRALRLLAKTAEASAAPRLRSPAKKRLHSASVATVTTPSCAFANTRLERWGNPGRWTLQKRGSPREH